MQSTDIVAFAVEMYTHVVEVGFPVALVFAFGNLMTETLLRVAFGGKLRFGGDK